MIIAFGILALCAILIAAIKIVAISNNSCCGYLDPQNPKEDLSAYEKGQKAYWDGKDINDVPDAQTEGWWDAQSEVMRSR